MSVKGRIVNDEMERPDCPECDGFMKSDGARQWQCTECGKNLTKVRQDDSIKAFNDSKGFDTARAEAHARKCEKKHTLIITSAQNNSEVFTLGLKSLKHACGFYNAELAVIPSHYRNMTLWSKGDKKEFDGQVLPYLVSSTIQFGKVKIHSDIKVQPTAVNPLSAMESIGGSDDLVIGHPQQMRLPVASNDYPKRMCTTGSVTLPNYSIGKAGAKAEFHHCMSAIILEKEGDFVFIRQITFDKKGHCYDLDHRFTPNGVTTGHPIKVLTTGDEHWKFNSVERETYGKGGMTERLKPRLIVRHDTLDGYAGSHHHDHDPMLQYIKHNTGDNDYRAELDECVAAINRTTPSYATTLMVPSNHHDHLAKFLQTADANKDHQNSKFISEMQLAMREAADKGENYDPFYLYCKDRLTCKHEFLDRNVPYLVDGIDYRNHGDIGINGARGSAKGIAKIASKAVIAHSHSACMYQGVTQVGTSTGRMPYARGLSSWSTTHAVHYKHGKPALYDIYNGRFCKKRRFKNAA